MVFPVAQKRSTPPELPVVELLVGETRYPATAVLLQGHAAALLMERVPAVPRHSVRLHLGWRDGRATTLDARVRTVHSNGQVVHLDIGGIDGAWEPFVEYLGARLRKPGTTPPTATS
jgi:hypothetical protein